jgi:hypothetical protein
MVTFAPVVLILAAIFASLVWFSTRRLYVFHAGVAVTLACWGAVFVGPPSYANALWFLLGLVGSATCALSGAVGWWRARRRDDRPHWPWLVGTIVSAGPLILLAAYQLLR